MSNEIRGKIVFDYSDKVTGSPGSFEANVMINSLNSHFSNGLWSIQAANAFNSPTCFENTINLLLSLFVYLIGTWNGMMNARSTTKDVEGGGPGLSYDLRSYHAINEE
jgi:hypothetical protein